jgi:hypothetical protein
MSQAFTRPALLLALLAVGCSDSSSPTMIASTEAPDAQYAALAVNPPNGVVRNVLRWVVVKHRGEWLVRGQQMTPVPPQP